jgi:hypothetical protein
MDSNRSMSGARGRIRRGTDPGRDSLWVRGEVAYLFEAHGSFPIMDTRLPSYRTVNTQLGSERMTPYNSRRPIVALRRERARESC